MTTPNPVPEYAAYFFTDKDRQLFGITPEAQIEEISITRGADKETLRVDDFFVETGSIYIKETTTENEEAVTYTWRQNGNTVQQESNPPAKPTLQRAKLNGENYTVEKTDFGGSPISIVHRPHNKPAEKLRFVEAAFETSAGLVMSVREGRGTTRRTGIAIFRPHHPHEYTLLRGSDAVGRLWKLAV